ncbi:hypothetical protein NA57DRAFT_31036 [Rhizodiscina lignyota]|uniref:Tafazzin n=1 Tax=Rhizodiscina lignyota TaxID=1504668 RepID=A0A9P4MAK0_9PEZI|nr:hypothetical protein NA57DRAFT_31036 [Rhizodiscina lignyota]
MPKKHHHDFTKLGSQYSYSSTSASSKPSDGSSTSSKTVNERLEQLRREQAPKASIEKRNEVSAVLSSPTVPPHLRHLLSIPETAPPKPKIIRGQRALGRGRPPPGPAAPQSWLHMSRHAPRYFGNGSGAEETMKSTSSGGMRRARGRINLTMLDNDMPAFPRLGSLMDGALKTMARHWDSVLEYEQNNLATLPMALKSNLLSYIALYGPDNGIAVNSLKTLFLTNAELPDATGSYELELLDLSGLVGFLESLSLVELQKYWTLPSPQSQPDLSSDLAKLSIVEKPSADEQVLESWDDDPSIEASIPHGPVVNRFPNLTMLSLSNPSPTVSWKDLLSLSVHLPTLTHLSLAHWPLPTLTPNSQTAFVESKHARVHAGGSNFYSVMDDDWHEAANILRRLSNNTYCLRYLDLEGCSEWLAALVFSPNEVEGVALQASGETANSDHLGPGWNSSWSQLTHLNISQGWIPTDVATVQSLPSGLIACELLAYMRSEKVALRSSKGILKKWLVQDKQLQLYQVKRWLEREKEARRVASTIKALRSSVGGKFLFVEHGWDGKRV